jgi:sodium/bile acid cotransporter 7
MRNYLVRRWFLIALALVLVSGIGLWPWLAALPRVPGLRQAIVATVMFVMALPLRAAAFWEAARQPRAPLLGSLVNYGLVPLLAWSATALLIAAAALSRDTAQGILVAATAPCTLASASVWTRRAGGNDAVAVMVTVLTNLFCFLLTPLWLRLMIGRTANFDVFAAMILKLGVLVVLPMAAAQALRTVRPVGAWATARKKPLGVLAQTGVLTMVLLGAIQTGRRLAESAWSSLWSEVLVMVAAVLAIHLAALFAGMMLARTIGIARRDAIAVGFAGSQKTLMAGLEVCAQLGVTILPMVVYHVGQLIVDTVVADRLRGQEERGKEESRDGS